MASGVNSKYTAVVNRDGFKLKLSVSKDVATMLSSPTTDGHVKEILIEGLIREQYPDNDKACLNNNGMSESCKDTTSCSQTPMKSSSEETDVPSCPGEKNVVHIWTDKQEDMLVHLRHEQHDQFLKKKNHNCLWEKIVKDLNDAQKMKITIQQAINKYNNLKKRWKEVIDSKSGSEAKYFRNREAFDQLYGTKVSNKPQFTIDSGVTVDDNNNNEVPAPEDLPEQPSTSGTNKKSRKRSKTDSLVDLVQKENAELREQMAQFQSEKLQRFDRLLNLYEMDIKSRNNNDSK